MHPPFVPAMSDNIENLALHFNTHLKLSKEPTTPPYSMMVRANQSMNSHMRSNSYSFDINYDSLSHPRPRAYSQTSVFDFDYMRTPKSVSPAMPRSSFNTPVSKGSMFPLTTNGPHTPPDSAGFPITPPHDGTSTGVLLPPISYRTVGSNSGLGTPAEIYAMCRDQRGCRLLQHKLQDGSPAVVARIFDATAPHVTTLMMDPFGNYFCQKLVEFCTPEQITTLLRTIHPYVVDIALNQHGTRALQRTIEFLTTKEQIRLLQSALDGSVVRIIRDINGNHVVQKCLSTLDDEGVQFIYDSVYGNIINVSSHRHGCCVLQRCLDRASARNKHLLASQIIVNALDLVQDPFGNYVCQYLFDLKVPEYIYGIIDQLLGSLSSLSVQKFSSNVVEKCLWKAHDSQKLLMIQELLEPWTLQRLLLDPYGNYVIQTALESTSGSTKNFVIDTVQQTLVNIHTPYGRRIMSKLKRVAV